MKLTTILITHFFQTFLMKFWCSWKKKKKFALEDSCWGHDGNSIIALRLDVQT